MYPLLIMDDKCRCSGNSVIHHISSEISNLNECKQVQKTFDKLEYFVTT